MNTGRSIRRHLCQFTKVANEEEASNTSAELKTTVRNTEETKETIVRNTEERREMNDVNPPDLSLVGMPENVQQNVAERREADPYLQPEQPTLSPKRTTRCTTRGTGVPVPNFPIIPSSTLEGSRRNHAAAE